MPQRFHNGYLHEVSEGDKPKPNSVLKFRRGKIPKPEVDPTDSAKTLDVVAGFITLESARKAMKPSARKQNRSAGTPELGDVCRMYNKTTQYNTTELVVASNKQPMKKENFELALYNLHVQVIGIGAKRIHIPMDQRILRGMKCLDILAALDEQFLNSDIEIHVWNVHICDKSGNKVPEQENISQVTSRQQKKRRLLRQNTSIRYVQKLRVKHANRQIKLSKGSTEERWGA